MTARVSWAGILSLLLSCYSVSWAVIAVENAHAGVRPEAAVVMAVSVQLFSLMAAHLSGRSKVGDVARRLGLFLLVTYLVGSVIGLIASLRSVGLR